jgi:chorismate synthase
MAGSTFGTLFRVTTFGESHCKGVGAIVDGVPPRLHLTEADLQGQLDRRRPGQSRLTTPRVETDRVTILSGTEGGRTLGTPIGLFVPNENVRPGDYSEMTVIPRPGHADYTYTVKYGVHASSGGGRSSARETIGRVAAGAIAEKWLREEYGTEIVTFVSSIGTVDLPRELFRHPTGRPWTRAEVDRMGTLTILRNPAGGWKALPVPSSGDGEAEKAAREAAKKAQAEIDSQDEAAFVAAVLAGKDEGLPAYEDAEGRVYTRAGVHLPGVSAGADTRSNDLVVLRCPHPETACQMATLIREVKAAQDSTGGVLTTVISGVPVGLGEPCFDKLEAKLAHAMLSLPATKAIEIGSGFEGTRLRGSQHNDAFVAAGKGGGSSGSGSTGSSTGAGAGSSTGSSDDASSGSSADPASSPVLLRTRTNNAGGTLGGISNGADIVFRVAIKPVSTISQAQVTADYSGKESVLEARGRHDPCVLPRAPPLVEGMAALVLADAALMQRSRGPVYVLPPGAEQEEA